MVKNCHFQFSVAFLLYTFLFTCSLSLLFALHALLSVLFLLFFSLFLPATMCSVKAEITLPHRQREEHLDRWRVSTDCESIAFKLNHFILFRYIQSSQLSFPLTWHFIIFIYILEHFNLSMAFYVNNFIWDIVSNHMYPIYQSSCSITLWKLNWRKYTFKYNVTMIAVNKGNVWMIT